MKTMKRNLLPTLLLVMSICSLFVMTSCEKDDAEDIITGNHSKEIVGEYPSECILQVMTMTVPMGDITTVITAKDTNYVYIETPTVTYTNKVFPKMKLESFVKEDVKGEVYSVAGNGEVVGSYNDKEGTFPMQIKFAGSVNKINKLIDLRYEVSIPGMPFPLHMNISSKIDK